MALKEQTEVSIELIIAEYQIPLVPKDSVLQKIKIPIHWAIPQQNKIMKEQDDNERALKPHMRDIKKLNKRLKMATKQRLFHKISFSSQSYKYKISYVRNNCYYKLTRSHQKTSQQKGNNESQSHHALYYILSQQESLLNHSINNQMVRCIYYPKSHHKHHHKQAHQEHMAYLYNYTFIQKKSEISGLDYYEQHQLEKSLRKGETNQKTVAFATMPAISKDKTFKVCFDLRQIALSSADKNSLQAGPQEGGVSTQSVSNVLSFKYINRYKQKGELRQYHQECKYYSCLFFPYNVQNCPYIFENDQEKYSSCYQIIMLRQGNIKVLNQKQIPRMKQNQQRYKNQQGNYYVTLEENSYSLFQCKYLISNIDLLSTQIYSSKKPKNKYFNSHIHQAYLLQLPKIIFRSTVDQKINSAKNIDKQYGIQKYILDYSRKGG